MKRRCHSQCYRGCTSPFGPRACSRPFRCSPQLMRWDRRGWERAWPVLHAHNWSMVAWLLAAGGPQSRRDACREAQIRLVEDHTQAGANAHEDLSASSIVSVSLLRTQLSIVPNIFVDSLRDLSRHAGISSSILEDRVQQVLSRQQLLGTSASIALLSRGLPHAGRPRP